MAPQDRLVTGGVDTHGDFHVASVLDSRTGKKLDSESFPANGSGYLELLSWMRSFGEVEKAGVESTGSFGAGLTRVLKEEGVVVVEVDRPDRKARRFEGKSDPTDAEAAARAALSGRASGSPKSRDGVIEALRAVEVVYHAAVKDRTRAINQFKSLLVTAPDGFRQRMKKLSFHTQLQRARRFSGVVEDPIEENLQIALKELARRIGFLNDQTKRLDARINELTAKAAPALVGLHGVGPHVAAQLLMTAGDNNDRMQSEASFAKLCGACPIPASSGKTQRNRLNRGGDRRANNALYTIVLVRMRHHAPTHAYVARRTADGKSRKEIIRCLMRYVAREIYQALKTPCDDLPKGAKIRELRQTRHCSLTTLSNAVGSTPIRISQLERGLVHDTALAKRCNEWLTTTV